MKKITILLMLFFVSNIFYGQEDEFIKLDSTYYYNYDGSLNWYYFQKDVYSVSTVNSVAFNIETDSTIVSDVQQVSALGSSNTNVVFSANSTNDERSAQSIALASTGLVTKRHLVVTKDKESYNDHTQNNYIETNGMVIVTFKTPKTKTEITTFAITYA